jgi:hypothetical protein
MFTLEGGNCTLGDETGIEDGRDEIAGEGKAGMIGFGGATGSTRFGAAGAAGTTGFVGIMRGGSAVLEYVGAVRGGGFNPAAGGGTGMLVAGITVMAGGVGAGFLPKRRPSSPGFFAPSSAGRGVAAAAAGTLGGKRRLPSVRRSRGSSTTGGGGAEGGSAAGTMNEV